MRFFTFALLAVAMAATSARAANIVANPGFESGDFTSWVTNTTIEDPWTVYGGSDAFDGNYYTSTGCVGSACIAQDPSADGAWLYQNLTTVIGDTYTLSFEFYSDGNPMELQVLWNGNATPVLDLLNIGITPYTLYSVTGLMATSTTTQIEFLGQQNPGFDGLDDVCVDVSGGVCPTSQGTPEPASLLMAAGGLAGLGLLGFRKSKA